MRDTYITIDILKSRITREIDIITIVVLTIRIAFITEDRSLLYN